MKIEDLNLIDSQKLIYHPKIVSDWLDNKRVYPIFVEISLTNICNHKCIYCAPNFSRTEYVSIETETMKKTLLNMRDVGVKAIMFGGEGEPFVHKDCIEIIKYAKSLGLDVAVTTNGVLLNKKDIPILASCLSWIKFSIDTCNSKLYSKLHGTKEIDMKIAFDNLSMMSWYKRLHKLPCVVGGQSILFKENCDDVCKLAKHLKTLKADYFVIKPFSDHEKRIGEKLEVPNGECIIKLKKELSLIESSTFKIILRENAFNNLNKTKEYDECYAQDFVGYINSFGGVFSCINYIDADTYKYGNINYHTFKDIWDSKRLINPDLDKCRTICRLDNMNIYLWHLKNNNLLHRNFI